MAGIVGILLVALLAVTAREARRSTAVPRSAYTLVQMNLCLSGRAACFPRVRYPLGVSDAVDLIRRSRADAVTLDEVCRDDVGEIAASAGLHARFAAVPYADGPVPCVDPGRRGGYGIAVLTKAPIETTAGGAYAEQDVVEQRHWLCVTTAPTTLCGTHLEVRDRDSTEAVNDAQCGQLAEVLERLAADGPVVAGGDMNRDSPCSAPGMRVATDADAAQAPGKQHVYTTADLVGAGAWTVPMAHTDHDALVVTIRLSRGREEPTRAIRP